MSVQSELAEEHQAKIIARTDKAAQKALTVWNTVDPNALDVSWDVVSTRLVAIASAAQLANAKDSQTYLNRYAEADGVDRGDVIVPDSFTGVDGSGRDIGSLLHGAVTTTKQGMTAGLGLAQSFLAGASYLTAMFSTAVHDVGRSSDLTAATGRSYTHYVRVISPGACSRCAMLAGVSSAARAFQRHPNCRCTAAPVKEQWDGRKLAVDESAIPEGFFTDPNQYFHSLSKAEQDRIFTEAGAEAIRSGADIVRVVSARRGATGISTSHAIGFSKTTPNSGRRLIRTRIGTAADGSPVMGYVTGESTTIRGLYGRGQAQAFGEEILERKGRYRSVTRQRLMPESIIPLTDDPELRRVLLRNAGYLDYSSAPELRGLSTAQRIQARLELTREDQRIADDFYARFGIRLG